MITASLVVTKTLVFIHNIGLLIFSRVGKQTWFVRARTDADESLSVGVMSRVMVTHSQTWCEI
ncbi:hypothetical protein Hanom_Chr01g00090011 [Helianthus anomalus]